MWALMTLGRLAATSTHYIRRKAERKKLRAKEACRARSINIASNERAVQFNRQMLVSPCPVHMSFLTVLAQHMHMAG